MSEKLIVIFTIFAVAVHQGHSTIILLTSLYLGLKIRDFIIWTVNARCNEPNTYYFMAPGQVVAEAAGQTLRYLAFGAEACLALIYFRFLAHLCPTADHRNALALHTVIFALIHCSEYILHGIQEKLSVRRA